MEGGRRVVDGVRHRSRSQIRAAKPDRGQVRADWLNFEFGRTGVDAWRKREVGGLVPRQPIVEGAEVIQGLIDLAIKVEVLLI